MRRDIRTGVSDHNKKRKLIQLQLQLPTEKKLIILERNQYARKIQTSPYFTANKTIFIYKRYKNLPILYDLLPTLRFKEYKRLQGLSFKLHYDLRWNS